jgi:hypothetical protein
VSGYEKSISTYITRKKKNPLLEVVEDASEPDMALSQSKHFFKTLIKALRKLMDKLQTACKGRWAKQTPTVYWPKEVHLNTNTYAWLTPVILASEEAEVRRIKVQGQPRQIALETLS